MASGHGESSRVQQVIFKTNKNCEGHRARQDSSARFTGAGTSVSGLIRLGQLIHPESKRKHQWGKGGLGKPLAHPRLVSLALITLGGPLPTNDILRLLGIVHRDDHSQLVIRYLRFH